MYGGAHWPIFADTDLLQALERKKTKCFLEYARRADHHVEAIEIPYQGKSLAAYLHLRPGYSGERLPCLVMIEGMDAFKELAICSSGDRFLRRGFACLVIDGPGQGTSLTRGIWYDPDTYDEVGTAAIDLLSTRPKIDAKRIMAWGLSFGSFWATQMAAAEPRFAACAVMYTCFQPHNWPLLGDGVAFVPAADDVHGGDRRRGRARGLHAPDGRAAAERQDRHALFRHGGGGRLA